MNRKNGQSNKVPLVVYAAAAVCVLSLILLVFSLVLTENRQVEFVPPAFDAAAETGLPEPPEDLGWAEIYQSGMEFKAGVCGVFLVENGKADVYFANTSENEAWLKLCVMDEDGNILGQTGLIRSGEYIRSVALDVLPQNGSPVTLKIMAYEPETYYSLGAVRLNTTVTVGGE